MLKKQMLFVAVGILFLMDMAFAATVTVGSGTTLFVDHPLSAGQVVVDDGACLSGSGSLTGSLLLAGTLKPGASGIGTFTVQSNLTCNGGTFELQASGDATADVVQVAGSVTGTARVLLSAPVAVSPQELMVVQAGAGSDYTGFSADPSSPDWLARPSGNNLMIHELAYDADGDGQTDYHETVAGTGINDINSLFQMTDFAVSTLTSQVQLGFNTVTGRTYTLEFCTNLVAGTWSAVPAVLPVAGDGIDKQFGAALNDGSQTFYRIGILRD